MYGENNMKWPLSQSVSERKAEEIDVSIFVQNISNLSPEYTTTYFGISQTNHYGHTLISSCYTHAVKICHTFKGFTKHSISILILFCILVVFEVFWDATTCHSVTAYQQLGESCCLRLVPCTWRQHILP
jgi:hypothetical protein